MVQIGLGLPQGHPMRCDGPNDFNAGTTHPLGIWKLLEQPPTECGQNVLLLLCGVCLFVQKRLTLREFNSFNAPRLNQNHLLALSSKSFDSDP
jgi:hypothetical protein